jgi:hypothetical protein
LISTSKEEAVVSRERGYVSGVICIRKMINIDFDPRTVGTIFAEETLKVDGIRCLNN